MSTDQPDRAPNIRALTPAEADYPASAVRAMLTDLRDRLAEVEQERDAAAEQVLVLRSMLRASPGGAYLLTLLDAGDAEDGA